MKCVCEVAWWWWGTSEKGLGCEGPAVVDVLMQECALDADSKLATSPHGCRYASYGASCC